MDSIEQIAATVGHDLEKPLEFAAKALRVIDTVVKAQPEFKQLLTDLIAKSEALGTEASIDVADRGASITLDIKTAADLLSFVSWVRSALVPVVLQTYGALGAALD